MRRALSILLLLIIVAMGSALEQPKPTIPATTPDIATVGMPAPDFTLDAFHAGTMKTISLSTYRGDWVVLFFYPSDFTYVCPTEVTAVAEIYPQLKEMDVEVLAISVNDTDTHARWQKEVLSKTISGGAPFPLLYDKDGAIGRIYHTYSPVIKLDLRGQFIIDPNGVLQASEVLADSVGRNTDELLRQLKAFQYVWQTKGEELLPVNWQPGGATLKPGK